MSGECEKCGEHALVCTCGSCKGDARNDPSEWINAADHLPKLEDGLPKNVLISDGENVSFGWFLSLIEEGDASIDFWYDEVRTLKTFPSGWPKVTHWMPLPDPPSIRKF